MDALLRFSTFAFAASTPLIAATRDELIAKYGCHQADRTVVGPSWNAVAARCADGSKSAASLASSIRAGNAGILGAIPMPPQPGVSEADANVLAARILQKKAK
jgi:cytochrome c